MAATITITERNGTSPGSDTNSITNCNFGSNDSPNLNTITYPLQASSNSYVKYWKYYVSNNSGGNTINNLTFYIKTGGANPQGGVTLKFNDTATYTTPTRNALSGTNVPVGDPASSNVTGTTTGNDTVFGNYIECQAQVTTGITSGDSVTLVFKYSETA